MNKTAIKGKRLTLTDLNELKPRYINKGFEVPKWIIFSETMIKMKWKVYLYKARKTVSKYIWIKRNNKILKIRFSNHKSNYHRELNGDCNYYVGIGNMGTITTEQVIKRIVENE